MTYHADFFEAAGQKEKAMAEQQPITKQEESVSEPEKSIAETHYGKKAKKTRLGARLIPELEALSIINRIMDSLFHSERARVIAWLDSKWLSIDEAPELGKDENPAF